MISIGFSLAAYYFMQSTRFYAKFDERGAQPPVQLNSLPTVAKSSEVLPRPGPRGSSETGNLSHEIAGLRDALVMAVEAQRAAAEASIAVVEHYEAFVASHEQRKSSEDTGMMHVTQEC